MRCFEQKAADVSESRANAIIIGQVSVAPSAWAHVNWLRLKVG